MPLYYAKLFFMHIKLHLQLNHQTYNTNSTSIREHIINNYYIFISNHNILRVCHNVLSPQLLPVMSTPIFVSSLPPLPHHSKLLSHFLFPFFIPLNTLILTHISYIYTSISLNKILNPTFEYHRNCIIETFSHYKWDKSRIQIH